MTHNCPLCPRIAPLLCIIDRIYLFVRFYDKIYNSFLNHVSMAKPMDNQLKEYNCLDIYLMIDSTVAKLYPGCLKAYYLVIFFWPNRKLLLLLL